MTDDPTLAAARRALELRANIENFPVGKLKAEALDEYRRYASVRCHLIASALLAATEEVERLRAALTKAADDMWEYGSHKNTCGFNGVCDCGFRPARLAAEAAAKNPQPPEAR